MSQKQLWISYSTFGAEIMWILFEEFIWACISWKILFPLPPDSFKFFFWYHHYTSLIALIQAAQRGNSYVRYLWQWRSLTVQLYQKGEPTVWLVNKAPLGSNGMPERDAGRWVEG